ncbi:sulfatase [Haloterrigena salifodinae]|uniref:Sulfatase n=1 Tax=Haloterrigena salifodinae TaxID=2675099 RepID=A0A8T8E2Q0_9EURY|nr:sulfatase [Haloterrigena salifodinae]QRV15792.1 sulfatase [Haloterrigena salifodinae]
MTNIILLALDSVRADHCSCYGYERETTPNIAGLADESYVFDNAYSTGSWTVPAHGSMFTGRLPTEHGAHGDNKYLRWEASDTLAGRLGRLGYDTACYSGNPWLTDEFGFGTGFDRVEFVRSALPFDDAGDPRTVVWDDQPLVKALQAGRWLAKGNPIKRAANGLSLTFSDWLFLRGERLNDVTTEWINNRENSESFFLFANYMDAHEPYLLQEPYDRFLSSSSPSTLDMEWNLHSIEDPPNSDQNAIVDAYDSALFYLDSCVKNFVAELESRELLQDTALIILGDHGQCLGEHGYWGHGTFLYDELLHVPMLVRPPGGLESTERVSRITSLTDVYELVLSFAEGEAEPCKSIRDGSSSPVAFAESMGRHQDVKLSDEQFSSDGYRATYLENSSGIHNLDTDTFEIERIDDSVSESKSLEQQLREAERNTFSELAENETAESEPEMDEQTQQRLEDLGYI